MSPPLLEHPDDNLTLLRSGITEDGCARIVAKHGPLVMAACRRILRDEGMAEDAAQETFVLLIQKARTLSDGTPVAGWLYHAACRIAGRHLRTAIRRRARESSPETAANLMPTILNEAWSEIEPHLDEAMLTLPERQRHLVVQCYFKEQPQRAAASAMGLSESVVSRELSAAVETLRRFFAKRGLTVSGTALIALLSANAAQGAGIATSGVIVSAMLATTATATGMALISTVVAMKMKLALAVGAVLLVSAVGYDLASNESWLARQFSAPLATDTTASNAPHDSAVPKPKAKPDRTQQLHDEAKDIWAKSVNADPARLKLLFEHWLAERDPDKQIAILHSGGIMISVAAYRSFRAKHPKIGQITSLNSASIQNLLLAWANEDVREALAWLHKVGGLDGLLDRVMMATTDVMRRDGEAWEIFLQASPDRAFVAHARLWMQEFDDPGSSWAMANESGVSVEALRSCLVDRIAHDPPDRALQALLRCPSEPIRRHALVGLAPKLSKEQLMALASTVSSEGKDYFSHYLRVMAGDASASFERALEAAWNLVSSTRDSLPEERWQGDYEWSQAAYKAIYARWIAADPVGAIKAANSGQPLHISSFGVFARVAHDSGLIDEQMIFGALTDRPKARDYLLAKWSQIQAKHKPLATLQLIMNSALIEDQVAAATPIIREWADASRQDAIGWLKSLPAGENRRELTEAVAMSWAEADPKGAMTFSKAEGFEIDSGVGRFVAVRFVSQLSPGAEDAYLNSLRTHPQYNQLLIDVIRFRFSDKLDDGLHYLQKHAQGDWQPIFFDQFGLLLPFNTNVEPYARALSSLPLEPLRSEALEHLCL